MSEAFGEIDLAAQRAIQAVFEVIRKIAEKPRIRNERAAGVGAECLVKCVAMIEIDKPAFGFYFSEIRALEIRFPSVLGGD